MAVFVANRLTTPVERRHLHLGRVYRAPVAQFILYAQTMVRCLLCVIWQSCLRETSQCHDR